MPTMEQIPGPRRALVRSDGGLWALERALHRQGFGRVAGVDEAGRGACAGPLVVAAVVFPAFRHGVPRGLSELADSKLLTSGARRDISRAIRRYAWGTRVVVVEPPEVDRHGVHAADLAAMRRAAAGLRPEPDYVLTDGFEVPGLPTPGLGVWKGDRVAACVAAASVLAKHTRDEMMARLDERWPGYGFAEHKGYVTAQHRAALARLGPCAAHRWSFVTVRRAHNGTDGAGRELAHEWSQTYSRKGEG